MKKLRKLNEAICEWRLMEEESWKGWLDLLIAVGYGWGPSPLAQAAFHSSKLHLLSFQLPLLSSLFAAGKKASHPSIINYLFFLN